MNDEFKSMAIKLVIVALTSLATSLHLSSDANFTAQIPALATDVVDLGLFLYTIYLNRGMKKVPDAAIVVSGPTAAPVVVAAQAVATLPSTASPAVVAATKAAAVATVADHQP